jgi:hypothetical protein
MRIVGVYLRKGDVDDEDIQAGHEDPDHDHE